MDPKAESEQLADLAERFGVMSEYDDIFGRRHVVSDETKRAILAAMGMRIETSDDVGRELAAHLDSPWRRACEPVLVRREQAVGAWSFCVPAEASEDHDVRVKWVLKDESGRKQRGTAGPKLCPAESRLIDRRRYVRFELSFPEDLRIGYYDLEAIGIAPTGSVQGALRLIVVPSRCYQPEQDRRLWGFSLQLYALRSERNWGVGDFGDLMEWVEWAAKLGADMIGLNPLHALKNSRPYHISPYSPDSRLYLNVLYLDVERVPEFDDSPDAQRIVREAQFQVTLDSLRQHEVVQYEQVYGAKLRVLEALFSAFGKRHCGLTGKTIRPRTDRGRAFLQYVREQGAPLEGFALFQALAEMIRRDAPDQTVWQQWPEPYRNPDSDTVADLRNTLRPRIRFYQYLQWLAAEQVAEAANHARVLNMAVGLYHDLALGSDRCGADAWVFQDVLALDADCGAPPDAFAPQGQNWGLPPVIPDRLRTSGYRMFIELLRNNLRYGGALRLDHVMTLFRLFWIPRGMPATAGTYVRYPWEDLLGILALESVRHRAIIIGEDLGTVPDFVREKLASFGVLSYRVFYFERNAAGEWKRPHEYPNDAIAVISTHDLPTLAGYWATEDIELRFKLGLFSDEDAYRRALDDRRRDKERILQVLRHEGLLPDGASEGWLDSRHVPPELSDAIHAYLARTPSRLMMTSFEDLIGDHTQINVPGTLDSYPNWSLKVPLTLRQLQADPRPGRLAALLEAIRPSD